MKTRSAALSLLVLGTLVFQGCVAFPPIVQVEHKDSASNQEVLRRLDAIDNRLNQIEQTHAQKPAP